MLRPSLSVMGRFGSRATPGWCLVFMQHLGAFLGSAVSPTGPVPVRRVLHGFTRRLLHCHWFIHLLKLKLSQFKL